MGQSSAVLKTLDAMDLKELKRVFKASFKIKALEPWRSNIEARLIARGVAPSTSGLVR